MRFKQVDDMTIGIKYCGGCNPRYDRTAFADRIRNKYDFADFVYLSEEEKVDAVIIFHGCNAKCTDLSQIKGPIPRIVVDMHTVWEQFTDQMDDLISKNSIKQ